MGMRRKPMILALVGALAAIAVALPVGFAMADDQPDTLVLGTITPAVAGQNIGVTVGGVACAKAAGITDVTGAYQLLLHNCGPGRATLTLNGVPVAAQFDLLPGNVYTENLFRFYAPEVAKAP
jgi:hypothetical protein